MDAESTPGAPGRQDEQKNLDELIDTILPIAKFAGEMLTMAIKAADTPEGKKVLDSLIDRFGLLILALAKGGMLPESGTWSLPWLALFLARSEDQARDATGKNRTVPQYKPTLQRMHRAADVTDASRVPGVDEETSPA